MAPRRTDRFRRLGASGSEGLLPRAVGRRLDLRAAWAEAAGGPAARRVRCEDLRRGVLELVVADRRWREALVPWTLVAAARMAAARPDLGIRRVRVRVDGEAGTAEPADLPPALPPGPPASLALPGPPPPPDPQPADLDAVRRRYLDRFAGGAVDRGKR